MWHKKTTTHTQKLLKHCISIRIIFVCIFTTTATATTTTTTTTTTYRNQSLGLSYVMVGAFGNTYPCWHSDIGPTLIQRTKMDQQSIYCYLSKIHILHMNNSYVFTFYGQFCDLFYFNKFFIYPGSKRAFF